MRASITTSLLLLASAIPLAKTGSCPAGYASEASWCVPMKNAPVAVPKGKGQCPSTMRQSGNYCIDTRPQRR
jgi:hypothetical protein